LRPHYYVGWNEPDEGNKKVKLRKSTHIAGNGPHGDCQAQTVFDYRKDCLSAMGEIPKNKDGIGAILAMYSQVYGLRNCEKEQMKNSAIQCNEDSLKPADVGQTRIDYANLR
jgi:hypothetical protein